MDYMPLLYVFGYKSEEAERNRCLISFYEFNRLFEVIIA